MNKRTWLTIATLAFPLSIVLVAKAQNPAQPSPQPTVAKPQLAPIVKKEPVTCLSAKVCGTGAGNGFVSVPTFNSGHDGDQIVMSQKFFGEDNKPITALSTLVGRVASLYDKPAIDEMLTSLQNHIGESITYTDNVKLDIYQRIEELGNKHSLEKHQIEALKKTFCEDATLRKDLVEAAKRDLINDESFRKSLAAMVKEELKLRAKR